ncbi:hypothetical protein ACET3Z_017573 [Daucus carota]
MVNSLIKKEKRSDLQIFKSFILLVLELEWACSGFLSVFWLLSLFSAAGGLFLMVLSFNASTSSPLSARTAISKRFVTYIFGGVGCELLKALALWLSRYSHRLFSAWLEPITFGKIRS